MMNEIAENFVYIFHTPYYSEAWYNKFIKAFYVLSTITTAFYGSNIIHLREDEDDCKSELRSITYKYLDL